VYNAFQPSAQGSYSITVKSAGKDTVIATLTQPVPMTNGNAYTIFLSGNIGSSGSLSTNNPLKINVLQAAYQ
jgi:hypothetical protein